MDDYAAALKSASKLLIDAVNDGQHLYSAGASADSWVAFGNLMPDLLGFIPQAVKLGPAVKAMGLPEVQAIVDDLATEIDKPNDHVAKIVSSVQDLFDSVISATVPKSLAVAKIIEGK